MTPKDKARHGLDLLKTAICDYLRQHPEGVQHAAIARDLDLESDFEGSQRNYLSWSVLGLLVNKKKVNYARRGGRKVYFLDQENDDTV